jgi:hypothetical protein
MYFIINNTNYGIQLKFKIISLRNNNHNPLLLASKQ